MCIILHGQAMKSPILNAKPRQKLLLMALANFAHSKTHSSYVHYETVAGHVGVGKEQIRRMMRQMEARDIVAVQDARGRGKSPHFQLNMPLINGTDKTPPTGGLLQELKPHLFLAKTPPIPQKNPTSNGGPIYSQKNIKGATSATCDVFGPNGPSQNEANILWDIRQDVEALTRDLKCGISELYGDGIARSWWGKAKAQRVTPQGQLLVVMPDAYRMKEALERCENVEQKFNLVLTHS